MGIKAVFIAVGCALSLSAVAGEMGASLAEEYRPWSILGSLGYISYNSAYDGGRHSASSAQTAIGDGQTVIERLAIARDFGAFKTVRFGAELGAQNGNIMRLSISQATLDIVGGAPVQATIKPM